MTIKQIITNWNSSIHYLELLNGSKRTACYLVEQKGKRLIRKEIENQHDFFDLMWKLGLKVHVPGKKIMYEGKTYMSYQYK